MSPSNKLSFKVGILRIYLTDEGPAPALRPVFLERRSYRNEKVRGGEVNGVAYGDVVPVPGRQFALRHRQWKFIETLRKTERELYNLVDDPGETVNLVEAQLEIVSELSQLLEAWRKSQARVASGKGPSTANEDVMRRLEALGYVP